MGVFRVYPGHRPSKGLREVGGRRGQLGSLSKVPPPHARAPREVNLTPGAARGCQAGLRPHWTHPAPAEMKDLTSHPIRNQAAVVKGRTAPEAPSSRARSRHLLHYSLTGGTRGDLSWSRAPGWRPGGTERHITSISKGFCAHHIQVPALHQHQSRRAFIPQGHMPQTHLGKAHQQPSPHPHRAQRAQTRNPEPRTLSPAAPAPAGKGRGSHGLHWQQVLLRGPRGRPGAQGGRRARVSLA